MFIETEFEDEIDIKGSTFYTLVEVDISGEVEAGRVTNVQIKSIYSKDDKKFIPFKELSHSEGERLLEKAEDKILNKYMNEGEVYDIDGYDDDSNYYDGDLDSLQDSSED